MVKFLDRLFGTDNLEAPASTLTRNDARFVAEVRGLKWNKFYTALEEHLGRPLNDEERELAAQAIDPNVFEDMMGEGIAVVARQIAENFGWNAKPAGWTPGQDVFSPMGKIARQVNFERGLAEYLGRPPSDQELGRVRQAFLGENDDKRKEFDVMVGEEAASYAKELAYEIGLPSAEESAAPAEDSPMRAAAK